MRFIRGEVSKFGNVLFCLFCKGIEDTNTAINGPSWARQRNTIEMAFRWRADDGLTLNAGLVALLFFRDPDQNCKETLYFFCFSGGSRPPVSPPLDPPMK